MKEFKKIIIAIVGFVVCFLVFDFGVGKFFDWAIKQMPCEGEQVAKSEYALNKVDADFIVLGSSRAQSHYDSRILQEAFHEYDVFNCGIDGQGYVLTCAVFNAIMDRYSPKVVLWDFKYSDLSDSHKEENLSLLYPYYYSNETIHSVIDNQDLSLKYILWCNSYRYNGSASRILRAMRLKDKGKKGFSAHQSADTRRTIRYEDVTIVDSKLSEEYADMLETTLTRAKDKGIMVFMVVSPYLPKHTGYNATFDFLSKMSDKFGFYFINDSEMESFTSCPEEFWYDSNHLNAVGAGKFTNILVEQIKEDIE